jgi:ATP/maltotriose-dependent transcriptional regulator MalT
MAGPLMRTKLFIPGLRRGPVPRPRVSERLDAAAEAKLVSTARSSPDTSPCR